MLGHDQYFPEDLVPESGEQTAMVIFFMMWEGWGRERLPPWFCRRIKKDFEHLEDQRNSYLGG